MDDGCCAPVTREAGSSCPASATRGKPVELLTVKSLLTEVALRRLSNIAHWFCPDPSCDVVYFDAHGASYATREIRVTVWQKEPFGDRTVCSCFGESEKTIREEILKSGRSSTIDRVRAHIAAGRCACEVRNPRGVCCLGDLAAAVERVEKVLREAATASERRG